MSICSAHVNVMVSPCEASIVGDGLRKCSDVIDTTIILACH